MLQHFKSHHLNILAGKLAEALERSRPDDPLESQLIIVPNLETSRWLKNELAKRHGIAANLHFMLPSEWQWKQIRTIYPNLPKKLSSDLEPMKWALFEILSDETVLGRFGVLKRYLSARGEGSQSGALFQLAGQIAYLFDQYQVYRPGMIVKWQNGYSGTGDEVWQSELWRLFDKSVKKNHQGVLGLNRAELFLKASEKPGKFQSMEKFLFLFNPGLIPKIIIELFRKYSESADLFLFQIQPSGEPVEFRNELLCSLGDEAGRISELLGSDEVIKKEIFTHSHANTDLGKIQEAIINNRPLGEIGNGSGSLQGIEIRSCHTPLREIETLHQFLMEQFESDDNLHPDEVLVVMPAPERYEAAIHAVFGVHDGELPQIPYHISGKRNNDDFGTKNAFLKLLNLADSRFAFSDVMDLFSIRAVYERYGLCESDTELVCEWMMENHVVWGMEASHREEWNQPAEKLQTWQEAIRRGWLGQWIESDETEMVNNVLLFGGADTTSKQKVWAAFSAYLNDLNQLRKDVKTSGSGSEWASWLEKCAAQFFSEQAAAQPETMQILRSIEDLKEACELVLFNGKIDFSDIRQEISLKLQDYAAGSANFNRGVVFSSMVPVRSIPFKIIALVGLNEDAFPRKPKVPEFDLMAQQPESQDRNRKEEDRNLFLESILATEKVHYCSYIGQSAVDNETIPPSSITGEWVDSLCSYSGLDPEQIIQKEPLSAFSPAMFTGKKSYSKLLCKTAVAVMSNSDKIAGLQMESIPDNESGSVIEVNSFLSFFANPVKWFLRNRFGAGFYSSETDKNEFEIDSLEKHLLFQRVFRWNLNGMPEDDMQNLLIHSGALPTGQTGKLELDEIIENVNRSFQVIESNSFKPISALVDISIVLNHNQIEGSLHSYSNSEFLSITPSTVSGKNLFQAWIGHLICSLSGAHTGDSYLITNLKKDGPKLFRFRPVESAEIQLSKMIDLFKNGSQTPELFFPATIYEFVSREKEGKPDSINKAREKFEGSDWMEFSESNDDYVKCLLGDDVKFSEDLLQERYTSLFEVMYEHMEEVKG
ncbi:MAG: exodeoxyribonuclease V subunit gamma [Balneolaceae bacterium]|nr:exodeoxyribonuclease V subunit gamma [Balneolaceae bacterium]